MFSFHYRVLRGRLDSTRLLQAVWYSPNDAPASRTQSRTLGTRQILRSPQFSTGNIRGSNTSALFCLPRKHSRVFSCFFPFGVLLLPAWPYTTTCNLGIGCSAFLRAAYTGGTFLLETHVCMLCISSCDPHNGFFTSRPPINTPALAAESPRCQYPGPQYDP